MAKKVNRQETIKKIVRENRIHTQAQLVEELSKLGHRITQATVSRDVNQLGLEKMSVEGEKSIYILPEDKRLRKLCEELVRSVETSGSLLVVKTLPGGASSVGAAIDAACWEEVVGTVSGDDTLLVVSKSETASKAVANRIRKMASV
jgi:transcriptional regulator of arginine metabolism